MTVDPGPPAFVPAAFTVPLTLRTDRFALVPLTVAHNEGDLEAWSSSVAHIHATPGFTGRPWPDEPMTLARNEADLRGHVADFEQRQGFTFSVLSQPGDEVIGCVYLYPSSDDDHDAEVRSWVRSTRADLDTPLYEAVSRWLEEEWPFTAIDYAPRPPVRATDAGAGGGGSAP
jgi:RimJ/RimL family protein N-acetyltransferase